MLMTALLIYKKLVKDIKKERFMLNCYDPCVANKLINGEQCTIVWHVDALKYHTSKQKWLINLKFGSDINTRVQRLG